jgi:hypothetical protein
MLKHAKISATDSPALIDCMVYDLTNSGAGLRISPEDTVPDRFELVFDASNSGRGSQVRWKNNERLGVRFGKKT